MLYAILCYNAEDVVMSWSQEEDDAVMAQLGVVHERLESEGKLGPSLRLMPTTAATTLIKSQDLVIDGPTPRPRSNCWASTSRSPTAIES